ncbi:hypothetical protein CCACVL1_02176 [Corchorus capsularis]|uniref:Uncharacterized protein n=1 Tax=Corchorus capsularis TaxID=210143 RepID=A0A1R3KAW4_COCAP|nr:hypothetical protein CCACVL1_02176 [Corchorus capsularis]
MAEKKGADCGEDIAERVLALQQQLLPEGSRNAPGVGLCHMGLGESSRAAVGLTKMQPRRWKKIARTSDKYSFEHLASQTNVLHGRKRGSGQECLMFVEDGTAKRSREKEEKLTATTPESSKKPIVVSDMGDFIPLDSSYDLEVD